MSDDTHHVQGSGDAPLNGRYRLVRVLGEGASGSVYLADDLMLGGRPVAVKLLRAADSASALERLREEAALAQSLIHPNIVHIYSFERTTIGEDGRESAFLAMEYVDGSTLRQLIADGPLPADEALRLFVQLVDALACAHGAGIVHRDLKPDNVLVTAEGTVKVTDFGIAKSLEASAALTNTGQVLGTAGYMAPELYRGTDARPPSDIYSLGLVLYELVYGRALQDADAAMRDPGAEAARILKQIRRLQSRLPLIDLLLALCCSPSADERPSSAIALKSMLEGSTLDATARRSAAQRRFNQRLASIARISTSVLMILVAVMVYLGRGPSPYSLAHLFGANIFYKFTNRENPGIFGLAPLDGFYYLRQRFAYGLGDIEDARRMSEDARRTILNCGMQHRLPQFVGGIPAFMLDLGTGGGKDCSPYPVEQKIFEDRLPRIAPLTLAAHYGERDVVEQILARNENGRISEDVLNDTYRQAVRMDRPDILDTLIRHGQKPSRVSGELLIEALMSPREDCLERLLEADVPIGFEAEFLERRVSRRDGATLRRWGRAFPNRVTSANARLRHLESRGISLGSLKEQVTPELLAALILQHPDVVAVLCALGFDWSLPQKNGDTAISIAVQIRRNPALPLLADQPGVDLNAVDAEGATPLIRAASNWDPASVRTLLRAGADPNVLRELPGGIASGALRSAVPGNYAGVAAVMIADPRTDPNLASAERLPPLLFSAQTPSTFIMRQLLERGADPMIRNSVGETALHAAARDGTAAHMRLLLARGVPPDVRSDQGNTPLMLLVRRGNEEAVAPAMHALLDAGADPFTTSSLSQTVFDHALASPDSRVITELLDAIHFDPGRMLPDGRLLLNMLVEKRRPTVALEEILKRGVRIDAADRVGRNALQIAIERASAALVTRLLAHQPDILDGSVAEQSYLNYAAERSSMEVFDLLLARGFDMNRELPTKRTVFTRLVDRAPPEFVARAIDRAHPDLNRPDKSKLTPLQIAISNRDVAIIKLLLARGADPMRVFDKRSALSTAIDLHDPDVLKALISDPRTDLNGLAEDGVLFLSHAAKGGDIPTVELLLKHGADPRRLDMNGRPPLFYAYQSGRRDVVERIRREAPEMASVRDLSNMDLKEFERIFGTPE